MYSPAPDFGKTNFDSTPARAFPVFERRFDLFGRFKIAPALDYRSALDCQPRRIDLSDHQRVVFKKDMLRCPDLSLEETIDHGHSHLDIGLQLFMFSYQQRAQGAGPMRKLVVQTRCAGKVSIAILRINFAMRSSLFAVAGTFKRPQPRAEVRAGIEGVVHSKLIRSDGLLRIFYICYSAHGLVLGQKLTTT